MSTAMGGSMYSEVRTSRYFRPKVISRLDSATSNIYSTNTGTKTKTAKPAWYTRPRSRSISSSRSSSPDPTVFGGHRQFHANRINKRRNNSIDIAMASDDQLPSIRDLFPDLEGKRLDQPQDTQYSQHPSADIQLPLPVNSPGAASEYMLVDRGSMASSARQPNDDAKAAYARSRAYSYRMSNSQAPRNAIDLPMNTHSASVSPSRRSSSGYGSNDPGRSFDSLAQDQPETRDYREYREPRDQPLPQPYGFPPRHSYTGPLPSAIPLDRQPLPYRPSHSDRPAVHQHPTRMQSRSTDLTARGYQSQSNHPYPYLHHSQHSQHQHSQHSQHHHHHQHHAQSHGYMPPSGDYHSAHDYYAPQMRNRDHMAMGRDGHHSHSMGSMGIRNSMAISDVRSRRESYLNKKKRGNLPKEKTDILTEWLRNNLDHPYPTDEQKQEFIRQTDLDMNQISNWFINARRRKCPDLIKIRERARRQLGSDDME